VDPLNDTELDELRRARSLIENPSLAARLTDLIGKPIEKSVALLPDKVVRTVHEIVESALERALELAVATMKDPSARGASERWHKLAGATSGAIGGFFGLAGLAVELPITTVIMLRSIGDIARSEGQDITDPGVRVACLEVFALGGTSTSDNAAETGYYAIRSALGKLVSDATAHIAQRGLSARGAPAIVRLLERIGSRFGLVVQEKVVLEMVPAIGAVSGALINTIFMGHFQSVARGHFIIRRLEARHGIEVVRAAYERLGLET
jgi:hypothetical protein